MNTLVQVIHASSGRLDVCEHEVTKYLREARLTNRKCNVSGMMLVIGGMFLQLLEGEAAMVGMVCSTIYRDKRNMRLISREPVTERQFAEWTMGFDVVDAAEAAQVLDQPLLLDASSSRVDISPDGARTLLSIIGRRRWQSDRSSMFRAIRNSQAMPSA